MSRFFTQTLCIGSLLLAWASFAEIRLPTSLENELADTLGNFASLSHPEAQSCVSQSQSKAKIGLGPAKRFLPRIKIPSAIKRSALSVKQLCRNGIFQDTCVTITAIAPHGVFVTNQHVCDFLKDQLSSKDIKFKGWFSIDASGKTKQVTYKVIKSGVSDERQLKTHDASKDICILKVSGLEDVPPIARGDTAKLNARIFHVGFPVKYILDKNHNVNPPQVSEGRVTGLGNSGIGNFLGLNGTSGGPVLDDEGRMIGLFWGKETTFREKLTDKDYKDKELGKIPVPDEVSYYIPIRKIPLAP